MIELNKDSKKIDTLFIMILFGMFAVTAFILVLIGIKQYKVTADSMNYNYEVRTASSYLREKIRQNDIGAGIHVENIDGTDVLALSSNINGQTYKTYIYLLTRIRPGNNKYRRF